MSYIPYFYNRTTLFLFSKSMETQIFEDIVHLLQGVDWLYNYPMTQVILGGISCFYVDSIIGYGCLFVGTLLLNGHFRKIFHGKLWGTKISYCKNHVYLCVIVCLYTSFQFSRIFFLPLCIFKIFLSISYLNVSSNKSGVYTRTNIPPGLVLDAKDRIGNHLYVGPPKY